MSLKAQLEAIIYAAETPITLEQIIQLVKDSVVAGGAADDAEVKSRVRSCLEELAGRKQVIGRPILYKTTKEFLMRFGLKDVNELPSMEEFEKLVAESFQAELIPAESASEETSSIAEPGSERSVSEEEEEPIRAPKNSEGAESASSEQEEIEKSAAPMPE